MFSSIASVPNSIYYHFGAIEIEGKRIIDKEGFFHTNISGFKEVYEEATEQVNFEEEYNFKVFTLAGIVILKLIAYDDRPEMRSNDIRDIAAIIRTILIWKMI